MSTAVAEMTMTMQEDAAYLARLRAGEEAAFERMVGEHIDRLYAYALRMLGNIAEAADAVQEAFLDAHRALSTFRGESRLTTWLHRIVHRRCLAAIRKRRGHSDVDELAAVLGDDKADATKPLENDEMEVMIKESLGVLPPAQKEALTLFYYSNMSYEEIAGVMDLPLGTVRTHIHRGKAAMRQILTRRGVVCND